MRKNGPLKLAKFRPRHFFQDKQIQSTFSKYTKLPQIRKLKNSHEQFISKFIIKSKNGQKWPKNGRKWVNAFFFGKQIFVIFSSHIKG